MIIDSNLVLFEGGVAGASTPVALTSLLVPGKAEPIPVVCKFTEDLAGAASVEFKLQQGDTRGGTYADVPGTSVTVAAADFRKGRRIGWRFLPRAVTKQWIKLVLAVSGTASAGKVFCAVVREEDEGYESGQHINKGITAG